MNKYHSGTHKYIFPYNFFFSWNTVCGGPLVVVGSLGNCPACPFLNLALSWMVRASHRWSEGCGFKSRFGNSELFRSKNSSKNIIIKTNTCTLVWLTLPDIHNILLYAYKLAFMTSLSCKKFKIIFILKRGDEGQLICIQKNIQYNLDFRIWMTSHVNKL